MARTFCKIQSNAFFLCFSRRLNVVYRVGEKLVIIPSSGRELGVVSISVLYVVWLISYRRETPFGTSPWSGRNAVVPHGRQRFDTILVVQRPLWLHLCLYISIQVVFACWYRTYSISGSGFDYKLERFFHLGGFGNLNHHFVLFSIGHFPRRCILYLLPFLYWLLVPFPLYLLVRSSHLECFFCPVHCRRNDAFVRAVEGIFRSEMLKVLGDPVCNSGFPHGGCFHWYNFSGTVCGHFLR